MHFEGEFHVSGTPDEVIRRFTDIERMARCVPGAVLEDHDAEGNFTGVIVVAFGPKRIRFRGKGLCEFDLPGRSGTLQGRGTADMRAARFEVRTDFNVTEDKGGSAVPRSLVKISSEATLGGVLAAFGGTGGIAVGNVLMQDFARNLAREFGEEGPAENRQEVQPVSTHKVVWTAVKDTASKMLSKEPKDR